jgi:hypothetical protein
MMIQGDDARTYKGRIFKTFDGVAITLFFLVLPYGMPLLFGSVIWSLLLGTLFLLAVFFPLAFKFHYFIITSEGIMVRNHFRLWKRHEYIWAQVVGITIANPKKRGDTALILKTTDGKTKTYFATALSDAQWLQLRNDLRSRNIGINDELGLDEINTPSFDRAKKRMYGYYTLYAIVFTIISWPVSTMETDTTSQTLLKLVLFLLLMVLAGYVFIRMMRYLNQRYQEDRQREEQQR